MHFMLDLFFSFFGFGAESADLNASTGPIGGVCSNASTGPIGG